MAKAALHIKTTSAMTAEHHHLLTLPLLAAKQAS